MGEPLIMRTIVLQLLFLAIVVVAAGLIHANQSEYRVKIVGLTHKWIKTDAHNLMNNGNTNTQETPDTATSNTDNSNPTTSENPAEPTTDSTENITPDNISSGTPNDEQPDQAISTDTQDTVTQIDLATLSEIITIEEAQYLYDNGLVIFIDARGEDHYQEGHIADAMSISYELTRDAVAIPQVDNMFIAPGEDTLIIYCGGGDCDESHMVSQDLQNMGFTCHIMIDGYPAWKNAGLPTAEGPDPWLGQ